MSEIEIDGSALEGGGQIVRNALAYSCILGKPIRIVKIRAGRSTPGLRPQHLCGAQLLRDVCNASLSNARVGSTDIGFAPRKVKAGSYTGDTKTAGSICLMLQTALPCMMFADSASELVLKGGTNADMAPQWDYMTLVTIPIAATFGLDCSTQLIRRGFYPKGGGEAVVRVNPAKTIKSVDMLEKGEVVKIHGFAFVAGTLPIKVAHIMADVARDKISRHYPSLSIDIDRQKIDHRSAVGNGSGIMIVAETSTGCLFAGSSLGNRDKSGEKVGHDAADQLMDGLSHDGCVDAFSQDQVIILMALASGTSRVKCGPITLHTQTAIHVAGLLTQAKFSIEKVTDNTNIITCEGIALQNTLL